MNVYLDNAATTPLSESMITYLTGKLHEYGNPSSQYGIGRKARDEIESVRKSVAKFVNLPVDGKVIFTSGGSASNNLALTAWKNSLDNTYHSSTLHPSLLDIWASYPATFIECDSDGEISLIELESSLKHRSLQGMGPGLAVVEHANSECGIIQPVRAVSEISHNYGWFNYVDCTGSAASIPIDMGAIHADAIGFSAHKLGALKGCGVLCLTENYPVEPLIYGEQEHGLFAGTENVLGILSLGYAVDHWQNHEKALREKARQLYERIVTGVSFDNIPYIIGPDIGGSRLPGNLYLCFPGIYGEALVELLDVNGIQISTGSACSTGKESHVLEALRVHKQDRHSCIRITLSGDETDSQLQYAAKEIIENVELLKSTNK